MYFCPIATGEDLDTILFESDNVKKDTADSSTSLALQEAQCLRNNTDILAEYFS